MEQERSQVCFLNKTQILKLRRLRERTCLKGSNSQKFEDSRKDDT
jgi:hypothetical protein